MLQFKVNCYYSTFIIFTFNKLTMLLFNISGVIFVYQLLLYYFVSHTYLLLHGLNGESERWPEKVHEGAGLGLVWALLRHLGVVRHCTPLRLNISHFVRKLNSYTTSTCGPQEIHWLPHYTLPINTYVRVNRQLIHTLE